MKSITFFCVLFAPTLAMSQEVRSLGAHEHGHSTLNIAVEGSQIVMALEAPGADIVGFEYTPKTAADRLKVDEAIAELSKPLELFALPSDAGCTVVKASAGLVNDHEAHDEHDHEAHDEHDHDAHGENHADDDAAEHTEFQAEYTLACVQLDALDQIVFTYFDVFPNAQEVDVQFISDTGARGFEVERDSPIIKLVGLI